MKISHIANKIIYNTLTRRGLTLETFGEKCQWTIYPNLTKDSFVVSGGAGYDISFELEVAKRFGCEIWLYDPSEPGRITFDKERTKPSNLKYFELGLDSQPRSTALCRPKGDPRTHSWTMSGNTEQAVIQTTSLDAILTESKKQVIDLLKIDIEGFEYDVLYSSLLNSVPIAQICVEIHQGPQFNNRTRWSRWRLILRLLTAGYRLVYQNHWDHTFIHKSTYGI